MIMLDEEELRSRMASRSTEELASILEKRDTDEWQSEVFAVVESILRERGVEPTPVRPLPEQGFLAHLKRVPTDMLVFMAQTDAAHSPAIGSELASRGVDPSGVVLDERRREQLARVRQWSETLEATLLAAFGAALGNTGISPLLTHAASPDAQRAATVTLRRLSPPSRKSPRWSWARRVMGLRRPSITEAEAAFTVAWATLRDFHNEWPAILAALRYLGHDFPDTPAARREIAIATLALDSLALPQLFPADKAERLATLLGADLDELLQKAEGISDGSLRFWRHRQALAEVLASLPPTGLRQFRDALGWRVCDAVSPDLLAAGPVVAEIVAMPVAAYAGFWAHVARHWRVLGPDTMFPALDQGANGYDEDEEGDDLDDDDHSYGLAEPDDSDPHGVREAGLEGGPGDEGRGRALGDPRLIVGNMSLVDLGEGPRVPVDDVVALLEIVGGRLEGRAGGSRFPLVWRLARALQEEPLQRWSGEELARLAVELETIARECESIPATAVPFFAFGDEGLPDIYSRETPDAKGSARTTFKLVLDDLKGLALQVHDSGRDLLIERRGPRIDWWD